MRACCVGMLDMFKRPTDPPSHLYLMGLPAAAMVGSYALAASQARPPASMPARPPARPPKRAKMSA